MIAELKNNFPKSVSKQDGNLPTVLARINHDYGNRFVIIIDEWDSIFREDKLDTAAQEAYLTLLIHLGYLAYDSNAKEVYIPNEEIRSEFRMPLKELDGIILIISLIIRV